MAIKIKIPKANGGKPGRWRDPVVRAGLGVFLILAVACTGAFSYFYIKYDRIIEKRFRTPVFSNSAKIYAQPQTVRTGENINAKEIATELRRGGYSDGSSGGGSSGGSGKRRGVAAGHVPTDQRRD